MIPEEVRKSAGVLGKWCLEEAARLRGMASPADKRVMLFYELVGGVCRYFLGVLTADGEWEVR